MPRSGPRYFFKVFFPDQSSNFLSIPPAFREHIEAECSKQVSLKGPSGGIWKVKLVKNSDGLIFEDGWKGFVADQSLAMGDFLIFRYDGNSRFKVLVFGTTACEKDTAFLARPSVEEENVAVEENDESVEGVIAEDEEGEEGEEENMPLVHFAKRRFEERILKKMADNGPFDDNGHSKKKKKTMKYSDFKMVQSNSVEQECESYSPYDSNGDIRGPPTLQNEDAMHINSAFSIRCRKTLRKLYTGNPLSGSCPPSSKNEKFSNARVLVTPKETVCRRGCASLSQWFGSFISQRRPVTGEEVGRTLERAMSFKSEHPFAVAIMQDSYVYAGFFMRVPLWFVKEHLPKEKAVLTVWDPSGKQWNITYVLHNGRGGLSGGWKNFSYANNLERYDACVFELIRKDHLKVHIYRVVDETSPLIRLRRRQVANNEPRISVCRPMHLANNLE